MRTAVEVEAKSIRLELPSDVHQKFRVEAAKEGASMAAVARRLVEEYLKRKEGRKS
jgi:plasmid stability protein